MVTLTKDASAIGAHSRTQSSNSVQETISSGVAAIKHITGLTIAPPMLNIYDDPTSTGHGFFDEENPSAININAHFKGQSTTALHELYHYLRFHRMFAKETAASDAHYVYCSSDSYLFFEEGAASFFSYVFSKDKVHAGDKDKYALLYAMHVCWSADNAKKLKSIYTLLSGEPETLKALDKYVANFIASDKERFERLHYEKTYDNEAWLCVFGELMFSLVYVAYGFDSVKVIYEHFKSSNADMLAHLVEIVRDDKKNNGPIGAELDTLIKKAEYWEQHTPTFDI